MNVKYLINRASKEFPENIAVIYKNVRRTFSDLNRRVNRLANSLLKLGIKKGDRVGMLLKNCCEFIIGVVLGPMTENSVRQTLMMFRGDMTRILDRPIALAFLSVTLAFIILRISYPFLRRRFMTKECSTS